MQMLEILVVPANHPQDIVGLAGHQMAFEHFGYILNGGLEGIERRFALACQPHLYEELHRKAKPPRIELGAIALHEAGIFQRLDTPVAGRGRQANRVTKNLYTAMGIALQFTQ